MSRRHTDTAVLDAARECVADVGIRRTTVSDVARRAGASRMTVYRLFPDADALWSTLVTREIVDVVNAAAEHAAGAATARARFVDAAVFSVRRLFDDVLVRRILELDPELLLPYVVERLGESQRVVIEAIAAYLAEGQRDGSVRPLDTATAAHLLELILRSSVVSSRVVSTTGDVDAFTGELRHLLNAYLAPAMPVTNGVADQ